LMKRKENIWTTEPSIFIRHFCHKIKLFTKIDIIYTITLYLWAGGPFSQPG